MKTVLKGLAGVVAVGFLAALGGFLWARSATASKLEADYDVHRADFPVPFPLTEEELAALRAERSPAPKGDAGVPDTGDAPDPLQGVDLDALALERAVARGKHLVQARYACIECHGDDFGGGVMLDDPAIGTLLGPNLTAGKGGKTASYSVADWDRIVRHGVKPDGKPAIMPSEDFLAMSDRELSDIIAYVRSVPPVDEAVVPPILGPVGTVLVATGKFPISAEVVADHHAAHAAHPPEAAESVEFGKHLSGVCTGCHRRGLQGGPIPFGPPDWAPASNLTQHAEGLSGWTFEQFDTLMRTGKRPDGRAVRAPMAQMMPYGQKMTETEMRALWRYLGSLPALPTGE